MKHASASPALAMSRRPSAGRSVRSLDALLRAHLQELIADRRATNTTTTDGDARLRRAVLLSDRRHADQRAVGANRRSHVDLPCPRSRLRSPGARRYHQLRARCSISSIGRSIGTRVSPPASFPRSLSPSASVGRRESGFPLWKRRWSPPSRGRRQRKPRRVVSARLAGSARSRDLSRSHQPTPGVTVFGAEPHPNYNRILLSPVLSGEQGVRRLVLNALDCIASTVALHCRKRVAAIDRIRLRVVTRRGHGGRYDRLLLRPLRSDRAADPRPRSSWVVTIATCGHRRL